MTLSIPIPGDLVGKHTGRHVLPDVAYDLPSIISAPHGTPKHGAGTAPEPGPKHAGDFVSYRDWRGPEAHRNDRGADKWIDEKPGAIVRLWGRLHAAVARAANGWAEVAA